MFRSSPQALLRASSRSVAPRASRAQISRIPRRYASTVPADKPRTWKSSALRWGLAGAIIYYYNTSTLFADQPGLSPQSPPQPVQDDGKFETLESITSKRRERVSASEAIAETSASTGIVGGGSAQMGELSPEELEQEAGQEGAFNPETGEINWDCPCLGGMADGPCGEEFKAAFSCFVFSKEDPKGIDCIKNFKGMQDCFRLHPDIYGAELESDDDDEELEAATASATAAKTDSDSSSVTEAKSPVSQSSDEPKVAASPSLAERAKKAADENIPKLKEKAQGVVDHAKDAVEDTRAQIAEKMPELSSRAQGAVKSTQKAVSEQVDRATDAVGARKRALAAKVQVQRDHGE